ncbi:phenylalanyl-tRNA synthetase beta chain [Nitratiruptor sp. YY08-26]|uniref:phenylalanine--tRNA ligase subunit beta n=1 Tax=unclassified Nitratiruptor TaxID=2624044 RepID=UPI001914F2E0|nr:MULTISPECIES: phenylalanine--tRNA ligase subunit beta [unclassified Nitratiruptor]BCD61900.1 phenylalanyl-tRNA synthetase beta chain [Nitratiruptor sp. YY08-13]BCD65835.1 phenylalanyl-tRNA synthetase beta chain [Nitratiruptor sp. YY08-26]
MIVTKRWLNEWIDIEDISVEELVKTLNRIGLEVAEVKNINIPANVVVGKVLSCQKHPNADKLNLCQVDVGDEELQIVCGAKNVVDAEYVAVAKVGAILPGDFAIKPAKLRGVESFGMICSSSELGLPKMEDGIMVLDESIGELKLGKELQSYPFFQDTIIDIELTANRGDCLSVLGIARELAAALKRSVKEPSLEEVQNLQMGIGRLLNFEPAKEIQSNLLYKAFEKESFHNPFIVRFRVALCGESFTNAAEEFGYFVTHATGVITRLYGYSIFKDEEPKIVVKEDEKGYECVYGIQKASIIGVYQFDKSKPTEDEKTIVLEMSYIDPETIAKKMYETPIKNDWSYYRSSRGSDPQLEIGATYAKMVLQKYYKDLRFYTGSHEIHKELERPGIKIEFPALTALIGDEIERTEIVEILKALGFTIVNFSEDLMVVKAPVYRHDIFNLQDVAEEIVRIYGIDNIHAKPLKVEEKNRINAAYQRYQEGKQLRTLLVGAGYFETISYLFTDSKLLEKLGLPRVKEELDIINPITSELNTLRTSLVPNLLMQVANNFKNGSKRVKLFEIGSIFDKERNEKPALALIFSGAKEPDTLQNSGKPLSVDFGTFADDLGHIFGDVELHQCEATTSLIHPYQCAAIIKNDQEIGIAYKLHLSIQEEMELPPTYIAEIDMQKLSLTYPKAKEFSIYQMAFRDMSILIDKNLTFAQIKEVLQESLPHEIKRFYPIATYQDEKLGDKLSLTLRFVVQSNEKTLSEEEIAAIMENILQTLQKSFNVELR